MPGLICGLDEAGRGPLAGPVCAAAVILGPDFPSPELLGDSKKLSEKRREEARTAIIAGALAWGVGWASAAEIDNINILQASLLAMKRAFTAMVLRKGGFSLEAARAEGLSAVADGLFVPAIPIPCQALVKADGKVREVMAASILAKTSRDRLMERFARLYPLYGYEKHKGYPTREHRDLVRQLGPSPIQRLSFRVRP